MAKEVLNLVNLRERRDRMRRKPRDPDAPSETFGIDHQAQAAAAAPQVSALLVEYRNPRKEAERKALRSPHEPEAYIPLNLRSKPRQSLDYTPALPGDWRPTTIGTRREQWKMEDGSLINRFGLRSRAAELYPGLFKPGANVYWTVLSDEERAEIVKLQAAAQERVGFTSGTQKFFIEDFTPVNDRPAGGDGVTADNLEVSPWEVTETDRGYLQRKRNYQKRQRELADYKRGKGKRPRLSTPSRSSDDGNAVILGMPTVWNFISQALPSQIENIFGGPLISQGAIHEPGQYEVTPGVRKLGTPPPQTVSSEDMSALSSEQLYTPESQRNGPARRLRRKLPAPDSHDSSTHERINPADLVNRYGLTTSSAANYPRAYAPVSREFRTELTQEQRDATMRTQALAQEKVGYEEETQKFFFNEVLPAGSRRHTGHTETDLVQLAAPRYVGGGFLVGVGLFAIVMAVAGLLPMQIAGGLGLLALLGGISMLAFVRG
ncbi:hypothetical protein IT575_06300 [bacterium]|nr:hypothetical protein [bacterium]